MKPTFFALLGCTVPLFLCGSARAAVVPTPPSEPESFTGTYTPTDAQSDGALLYGATLPAAYGGQFVTGEQSLFMTAPAGLSVFGPITVSVPIGATDMRASVFSVYDTADDLVTLVLDDTVATSVLNEGFSTVFTNASYDSESDLAAALIGDDVSYLKGFFDTYTTDFPEVTGNTASGTLVNFSNAATGGTAELNFTPVPEPSTWATMIGGLFLLGGVQRRRGARRT